VGFCAIGMEYWVASKIVWNRQADRMLSVCNWGILLMPTQDSLYNNRLFSGQYVYMISISLL